LLRYNLKINNGFQGSKGDIRAMYEIYFSIT